MGVIILQGIDIESIVHCTVLFLSFKDWNSILSYFPGYINDGA